MAKLSDIAKVLIELRTASIAKANFGIPMIAVVSDVLVNRAEIFREYNDALNYKGTGGLPLEQSVIDAVRVAFSQDPRIDRLVVGKLDGAAASQAKVDPAKVPAEHSTTFTLTIDGVSFEYITPAADPKDDASDVLTGIMAKISANATVSGKYTFTQDAVNGVLTVVPKVTTTPEPVMGTPTDGGFTITAKGDLDDTIEKQLNTIQGYNNSWYGFALVGLDDATAKDASAWAEATDPVVMFFTASDNVDIWSAATTDMFSELQKLKRLRTLMIATRNADKLEAVAEMCRFFVGQPGQIVAGLKQLGGVLPTEFTPQEQAFIFGKNGNTYEQYAENTYVLNKGKVASGEWADVVRDRDWLIDDIQKAVASGMLRNPKIPYTNAGITIIYNILYGRLRNAQKQGVIAPDQVNSMGQTVPGFVITVPNAADVDADTRASRKLTLSFVGLLAGAIQEVEVNGVLTYTYETPAA